MIRDKNTSLNVSFRRYVVFDTNLLVRVAFCSIRYFDLLSRCFFNKTRIFYKIFLSFSLSLPIRFFILHFKYRVIFLYFFSRLKLFRAVATLWKTD